MNDSERGSRPVRIVDGATSASRPNPQRTSAKTRPDRGGDAAAKKIVKSLASLLALVLVVLLAYWINFRTDERKGKGAPGGIAQQIQSTTEAIKALTGAGPGAALPSLEQVRAGTGAPGLDPESLRKLEQGLAKLQELKRLQEQPPAEPE